MPSHLFHIEQKRGADFGASYTSPQYHILLFGGQGRFAVDFTEYAFSGNTALFFTPYQDFSWRGAPDAEILVLAFHGDFYCIEYHKKEVACNGLLFNNIYLFPHIGVSDAEFDEIALLFRKLQRESERQSPFSEAILRAYLQLILAICSREKSRQLHHSDIEMEVRPEITYLQNLLNQHFLAERSPAFYAHRMALSVSAFSKKTKQFFGKTPSQLIQDRVILEAKKLLHLTYKPIKEIAAELNFDDEFYFSRYFKKNVGLSPAHYREEVGISVVAK